MAIETWDALAAALNIPVREIYRERKKPAAPQDKDLDAWLEYYEGKAALDIDGLTPTTYDERLRSGKLVLDDALSHSRLVEQEIINERRREELKKVRGDTVPKDEVEKRIRAVTAAALEALAQLPDIVADSEPTDKPAMRQKARAWVDAVRARMAEKIRLG